MASKRNPDQAAYEKARAHAAKLQELERRVLEVAVLWRDAWSNQRDRELGKAVDALLEARGPQESEN